MRRSRPYLTLAALILLGCLLALSGCGDSAAGSAPAPLPSTPVPATATMPPAPTATTAGSVAPTATPADDLAPLSDEFDDAHSLTQWTEFAEAEGWPNRVELLDINTTSPGQLYVVPSTCTWFGDYHGVFLFKDVSGDFDVTTRIQATGKQTPLPQRTFSLTGLMARVARGGGMQAWQPLHENWVFITTGYGDNDPRRAGKPQIETKTTTNSNSVLVLKAVRPGPVDLRVVRLGADFLMLYRQDSDPWKLSMHYQRPDLPAALQVGLNAYTNWESIDGMSDPATFNRTLAPPTLAPPDLVVRSDYIRFRRPQVSAADRAKIGTGDMSATDWLDAVGP